MGGGEGRERQCDEGEYGRGSEGRRGSNKDHLDRPPRAVGSAVVSVSTSSLYLTLHIRTMNKEGTVCL